MYEGNLVICDQEQQYSRNLLQMFAQNRETDIQMYLFHTIEEVEKFAEQKPVHTLLIGREYPSEQRKQIPAAERFVLIKNRQDSLAENEVGIYRYQSAEDIWSQMCYEPMVPQPGNVAMSQSGLRTSPHSGSSIMPQSERPTSSQSGSLTMSQSERVMSSQPGSLLMPQSGKPVSSQTGKQTMSQTRRLVPSQPGRTVMSQPGKPTAPQNRKAGKPENPGTGRRRQQEYRTEERGNSLRKENKEERGQVPFTSETDEIPERLPEPKSGRSTQKTSAGYRTDTRGELIGVYSPVHRIGKTRFAMELGREMAKKEPVLYLNLEEYAGGSYYFPDQTDQTLADLLYYSRQEKGNLGLRISTMAGQDEALDYILPMPCVQDLQGVSGEEWLRLFGQIRENCIYQKVILDLGDSVNGLFQILEACHTVYTPYIEDEIARAKLNQYAENLRRTGREKVLEKTIQKKLKQR